MDRSRKRKKEDEEAELTKAYEQFRETFEGTGPAPGSKSFIRGAVVNANKVISDPGPQPTFYKPRSESTRKPSTLNSFEQAKKIAEERAKQMMEEAKKNRVVSRPPRPGQGIQMKSKTSNLEAFKEELRTLQEEREQRRSFRNQMEKMGVEGEALDRIAPLIDNPYLHGNGEYDNDPNTTNLYISNMSLEMKIDDLYDTFGSFGPLASAKILYPRDEERKRDHLCGFIAFMVRKDTDRALAGMQGKIIKGSSLRLSFAKPVNIPPQPIYVPPALMELALPDPPTGLPFNAKPRRKDLDALLKKCPLPRLGGPLPEPGYGKEEYEKMLRNAVVRVVVPTERNLLILIHRTVEFVVREGPLFEAMLMSRERQNPLYRFLFDNHHPAHVYYRWKLFSILQGDPPHSWRLEKFKMFDEGSWWQPPSINLLSAGMPECLYHTAYTGVGAEDKPKGDRSRKRRCSSSDEEDDTRRAELKAKWKGVLSTAERDELEDLLRELLPEKNMIGDAMVWCADHATCSKEISQCLLESLTIDETPLHKKIARLYLISDILANCAARVRDVFYYRQYLGDLMPEIFKALNKTHESIESRLKAEQFKQRVMLCFRAWEDNAIYPTEFLIDLQNIFLGLAKEEEETEEDIDGAPMEDSESEASKKDAIFNEEDIDGAPIDEEPNPEPVKKKVAGFKAASWSTVDPVIVANQAVTTSKWDMLESGKDEDDEGTEEQEKRRKRKEEETNGRRKESPVLNSHTLAGDRKEGSEDGECPDDEDDNRNETNSTPSRTSSGFFDEERRKILREIEVKVVKLQDDLEAEKCENVAERAAKYRAELMKKMEEKLDGSKEKKRSREKSRRRSRSRDRKRDEKRDDRDSRDRERERMKTTDRERGREGEDKTRYPDDRGRDKVRERERSGSKSRERRLSRREHSNERRKR